MVAINFERRNLFTFRPLCLLSRHKKQLELKRKSSAYEKPGKYYFKQRRLVAIYINSFQNKRLNTLCSFFD